MGDTRRAWRAGHGCQADRSRAFAGSEVQRVEQGLKTGGNGDAKQEADDGGEQANHESLGSDGLGDLLACGTKRSE